MCSFKAPAPPPVVQNNTNCPDESQDNYVPAGGQCR